MLPFKRTARPSLECLTERIVPAMTYRLANGTLFVQGDNLGHQIEMTRSSAGLSVAVDGGAAKLFNPTSLVVQTGNGADVISLQRADTTPLVGSVVFQSGAGDDQVFINDSSATAGKIVGS